MARGFFLAVALDDTLRAKVGLGVWEPAGAKKTCVGMAARCYNSTRHDIWPDPSASANHRTVVVAYAGTYPRCRWEPRFAGQHGCLVEGRHFFENPNVRFSETERTAG